MTKVLILGGTAFIGRSFVTLLEKDKSYEITLCNRGVTNPQLFPNLKKIRCDRNQIESCSSIFNEYYDFVIDFCGYNYLHMYNISRYLRHYKYIYISSMAVLGDIELLDPHMKLYAHGKRDCESFVDQYYYNNYTIIRPPYVCGEFDYLGRFIEVDGSYFHKIDGTPVEDFIKVEDLSKMILKQLSWEDKGEIISIQNFYEKN